MLISKFDTANISEHIKMFEEKHGFAFPGEYRRFLEKYNGGRTPDTDFRLNKVSSDIRGFYGFGDADKYYNYRSIETIGFFSVWLHDGKVPVASNSFGDYILLGLGEEDSGKVYFFYHDRPKKYIELAADFRSFVGKCKSKKIGHIRTIEERKQGMIDNGLGDEISIESIKGWQAEIDLYSDIHQEELLLD